MDQGFDFLDALTVETSCGQSLTPVALVRATSLMYFTSSDIIPRAHLNA
jgi:hypothetical protein